MIKFLLKGLLRDRSRSLFPVLVVVAGVALTVLGYCWIKGAQNEMVSGSAHFSHGHVKIMTQAYAREADQVPNDLGLVNVASLLEDLNAEYPDMIWLPRIQFGGLLDIPDENGETRAQGPVVGMAIRLFDEESPERNILNLDNSLVSGRFPDKSGEILISDAFAKKLGVAIGETATLIGSSAYGGMAMSNFRVVGTLRFGVAVLDRGAMVADVSDIQYTLDMPDGAGEILGFFEDDIYDDKQAHQIAAEFNEAHLQPADEFSPVMKTLREASGVAYMLDMTKGIFTAMILLFVFVMSMVLWNAGLISALRRYGEIGVRLAIGEDKGHIYRAMLAEALMIGIIGSALGTLLGLAASYYLQTKGIDISGMMQNASMILSNVMRARVTPVAFIVGFLPGLMATLLGTAIAGIGIYKRQTSQLFKELEV
ncbi:FtsX-like permease family protein [candidate division KSB1 bacterium]|nr:FtsX-like permease family protein [candidate division KSB1 bacterium]